MVRCPKCDVDSWVGVRPGDWRCVCSSNLGKLPDSDLVRIVLNQTPALDLMDQCSSGTD